VQTGRELARRVDPILADRVTGQRYVAALWDPAAPVDAARRTAEAPIAWPELATAPVWPGGTPKA